MKQNKGTRREKLEAEPLNKKTGVQNISFSFFWNKKFWIILGWIITTAIAVFGGIPGFKQLIAKPEFKFKLTGQMMSSISHPDVKNFGTSIFISGAIYNPGDLPLFPDQLKMEMLVNGDTVPMALVGIPFDWEKRIQDRRLIRFNEPHKRDIAGLQRVNPHDAFYGHLLFVSDKPNVFFFNDRNAKYRLILSDLDEKKYYTEYFEVNGGEAFSINDPKSNIILADTAAAIDSLNDLFR